MIHAANSHKTPLTVAVIFLFVCIGITIFYSERTADLDKKNFATHAAIVSDDLWALNQSGANVYLQLAVKANHYKTLSITIPGDDTFISVTSPPLTGLSLFLHKIKLIGLRELSQNIIYKNQLIGVLNGEKYIRIIFPLFNILIFLLLVLLTGVFMNHLFKNRKLLEEQVQERTRNLKKSERRFHDLVNLLPEMVLETDLEGNITYANKAASDQLGLSLDNNPSTNFFQLIAEHEREEIETSFRNSLAGNPAKLLESTVTSQENISYPTLIRSAPITDGGMVSGARVIVIDISDQRLLEEQLHRDQKMKAIGLMAGGVAHDLNNILSGIVSYPELLLLDLAEDSTIRRPLEAIRRSGLEASEVVSDLLTVARGIAASKETVEPNELICNYLDSTDFLKLQQNYPHINIDISFAKEMRNITCSPIHVRKCLMNLIVNSLEAIEESGTLSLVTENHDGHLPFSKSQGNCSASHFSKIIIKDDGPGISHEDMEHIFEPFYTKKVMGRSGTGLGLAVVWNTMHDHGGRVNVISSDQGTIFELYFPSTSKSVPPKVKKNDWKTYLGKGEKILVIDDELRQREIASQLLTSLNFSVDTVSSGEDAIEFAKTHSVDLLVLDMIMPPGINGRETYEEILKIHPKQRAIIASGFADDDDVKATLSLGAEAFIQKPYTFDHIASVIHKLLYS